MKLSPSRVEANRNFCNKIWQASRFVLANLGDAPERYAADGQPLDPAAFDDPGDRWIISRFHQVVSEATRLFEAYQLGEAGRQVYEFLWGEYCDWYIEMTKPRLRAGDAGAGAARQVLVYVLDGCLRLLHPYMPFVTEAIWQYLPHQGAALIVASWPESGVSDVHAVAQMAGLMELIRVIRNARSENDVEPGRKIAAIVCGGEQLVFLQGQKATLGLLARIDPDKLTLQAEVAAPPDKALTLVVAGYTCYLPLADLVDLDKERQRLQKEIDQVTAEIGRSEKLLANKGFVAKAPEAVVAKERQKLEASQARREQLVDRLAEIG